MTVQSLNCGLLMRSEEVLSVSQMKRAPPFASAEQLEKLQSLSIVTDAVVPTLAETTEPPDAVTLLERWNFEKVVVFIMRLASPPSKMREEDNVEVVLAEVMERDWRMMRPE